MILSLLTDIISQRVRSCKIILQELLIQDIPHGKPIPVVLGAYGLSLVSQFPKSTNKRNSNLSTSFSTHWLTALKRSLPFYQLRKRQTSYLVTYCAGLPTWLVTVSSFLISKKCGQSAKLPKNIVQDFWKSECGGVKLFSLKWLLVRTWTQSPPSNGAAPACIKYMSPWCISICIIQSPMLLPSFQSLLWSSDI